MLDFVYMLVVYHGNLPAEIRQVFWKLLTRNPRVQAWIVFTHCFKSLLAFSPLSQGEFLAHLSFPDVLLHQK